MSRIHFIRFKNLYKPKLTEKKCKGIYLSGKMASAYSLVVNPCKWCWGMWDPFSFLAKEKLYD